MSISLAQSFDQGQMMTKKSLLITFFKKPSNHRVRKNMESHQFILTNKCSCYILYHNII